MNTRNILAVALAIVLVLMAVGFILNPGQASDAGINAMSALLGAVTAGLFIKNNDNDN